MANSWGNMTNLALGQLVAEADLDTIRTNIDKIGGQLVGGGTARKDLEDGVSEGLVAADYDSGWFAVVNNTTYTKPHALAATPSLVILEWSSAAAPGAADEVVIPHSNGAEAPSVGYDGTNIYITSGPTNTVNNARAVTQAAGYYRVQAWK